MSIFKYKPFFCTAALACTLIGCTSTVNSDDPLQDSQNDYRSLPLYEQELLYNYEMLDLFYFYAHTRNELSDDIDDYYRHGTAYDNTKGFCTEQYFDICYMYNQMRDPFTRYFDPNVADQVLAAYIDADESTGIGAESEEVEIDGVSKLRIASVYPKSPAEKAGLKEGDIVVSIDGLDITKVSSFERLCTGKSGDVVQFVVLRGGETIEASVTLDVFTVPTVFLHYEDSIPVIQITGFTDSTVSDSGSYGEFVAALQKTEGAAATIIDLRGNPGGSTDQCNDISSEMLNKGDTIAIDIETNVDSVLDRGEWRYVQKFDTVTYTAGEDGIARDRYFVMMADTGSASCAELMLSAIATNKYAPIVGMLTYGKQIGQRIWLSDVGGGVIVITGLESVDKNGESFLDMGIVPDFEIADPDLAMQKAVELAKGRTVKRTAGYGSTKLGHFSKKAPESRGQLPKNKKDLKTRYKLMQR